MDLLLHKLRHHAIHRVVHSVVVVEEEVAVAVGEVLEVDLVVLEEIEI